MIDATSIIDYTHDQFVTGIESIASQIKQSGFEPDLIVGIVRGGAVPAVHLSHKLKTPVQMVHWSTRDANGCESNCWIPEDIQKGCNILLVDDIVDGGDTIRELLADWQKSIAEPLKRENIRIAAMWYNVSQDVTVDFYHRTIDREQDSRWIVFDWE
jgi:hypoxanthine phosphoribosyltransferase